MSRYTVTGQNHGDHNGSFVVDDIGERYAIGSASEANSNFAPKMGTASVYMTNLFTEVVLGGKIQVNYRIRIEWPSDLYWTGTIVLFKSPGGPFG